MKNIALSFTMLALFLVMWSCTKENQVADPEANINGAVSISFDKASCPQGVMTIAATLTRSTYSTITRQLNITSSSTAEITINDIVPGIWHLKVNALDENGVVLYSGETDINVISSATTTANLVLSPTGKLQLSVSWANNTTFSDYAGNPVFSKNNSINNPDLGVASSFILYEDGKYKMWYANMYNDRKYDINYAESSDGVAWSTKTSLPVISPGTSEAWDAYAVYPGSVLKDGAVYKMYYVGVTSTNGDSYVGLATSADGINWTKNASPVLMFLHNRMAVNTVLIYNNKYYMYFNYTNTMYGDSGIGLATSTDGITWNVESKNIIPIDQSWETNNLISPCVRYEGGQFRMIYSTLSNNGFGSAVSADGIVWTKSANNPFFTSSNTIWSSQVRYPYLVKVGNKYRLYYTGYSNNLLSIAFAEGTL
jgi:predicted GH43/DUF377 family glycosyl hydrolase